MLHIFEFIVESMAVTSHLDSRWNDTMTDQAVNRLIKPVISLLLTQALVFLQIRQDIFTAQHEVDFLPCFF